MSCIVMVESSDGGVESSRVEGSCVVMVQYSCDGGGGGVKWSRGELSCNGYSLVVMVEAVESKVS